MMSFLFVGCGGAVIGADAGDAAREDVDVDGPELAVDAGSDIDPSCVDRFEIGLDSDGCTKTLVYRCSKFRIRCTCAACTCEASGVVTHVPTPKACSALCGVKICEYDPCLSDPMIEACGFPP